MRDTLFISLFQAASDGRASYGLLPGMDDARLEVRRAELDEVLEQAAGKRLVVLVPATDVRLATIQVPARQPQKVLQAAPFALEDALADDVETLHFAIGARQADGSHPVAVVSRDRMAEWLAPLKARGLIPEAMVPESLCLPPPAEGQWTGLVERPDPQRPPRLLFRTGVSGALACSVDDLDAYLDLADPDRELRLRLFVTDGVDHDFTRQARQVELLPGHATGLEALAYHYAPDASINLLQGEYAQQAGLGTDLKRWKAAAILAGVCALLAVTYEGTQAWKLGQEMAELDAQNLERFQSMYPEETRIVDLAAQTQQKIVELRGGGGGTPWFQSLEVLNEALQANDGLELRSVQFRDGALYLYLTGTDLQAFEKMRLWFEARPDAQISDVQANSGTDGVQVRFKMTLA